MVALRILPYQLTIFLISILFISSVIAKPKLTQKYQHGPIEMDKKANFYFTIDTKSKKAKMAIVVSDKSIPTTGPAWVGIGISEPSSGSMLGSDIATAEWDSSGASTNCTLKDRYVPFAAYPLIESVGEAQATFPLEDSCQDDGSWILKGCSRERGGMVIEVERDLEAHDTQDRDIVPGTNNVLYAYGGSFAYHGGNRHSSKVVMYKNELIEDLDGPIGKGQRPLPNDVDGNFTITATGYSPPEGKITTYACTGRRIPLKKGEKRMIVAVDHLIDGLEEVVHHFTVQLCKGEKYFSQIQKTRECSTADDGFKGPLGNPEAQCTVFVMAWAKGMQRYTFPNDVGIVIDDTTSIAILETHYDNPNNLKNINDKSGVVLHTTSKLRKHEAGSLQVGDPAIGLFGETVKSNFEYEFSCPSGCTEKFTQPINLFASFLHMHTTGQEIYINKFSKSGEFIENVNKVNFWSDSFQNYENLVPPKQLSPGEQLQTTCLYDTRKRPNTTFGLETKNEMCMTFIGYWPVQRLPTNKERINMCAFGNGKEGNFTVCGDQGTDNQTSLFLPITNPVLEDKKGAPTDFGEEQKSCDANGNGSSESSDDDDNERMCFPADGMVRLRNGNRIRMDELKIGDEIGVGNGVYSEVFLFTHNEKYGKFEFVELHTSSTKITLTKGHYLYVDEKPMRAGLVKEGMKIQLENGRWEHVVDIKRVQKLGLYNPQTLQGNIVVDGVVASTYTTAVGKSMPVVPHSLLAPVRWTYSLIQATTEIVSRT